MKNSNEWIADIKEKVKSRYARQRKTRILFMQTGSLAAVMILVVAAVILYPQLTQSSPDIVAQNAHSSSYTGSTASKPESGSANTQSQVTSRHSNPASRADSNSPPVSSASGSAPAGQSGVYGGGGTAGLADIFPNITYNQIHYNMTGNVIGDDPSKFVGASLGSINGYFVHKGPGTRPLETDKIYSVTGFDPNFVICADTSVGWEFFVNDRYGDPNGPVTSAELYGKKGLNLLNQYVSVSYYLDGVNSASIPQPQTPKPLNLSKSDLEDLFHYLTAQPFAPIAYRGECNFMYRIEIKLSNGTTAAVELWEYSNQYSNDSFIEFAGTEIKLNSQLKQKLDGACS